jgi:hypothetical protein
MRGFSSSPHIPLSPNESPSMTISGRTWNGRRGLPWPAHSSAQLRAGLDEYSLSSLCEYHASIFIFDPDSSVTSLLS